MKAVGDHHQYVPARGKSFDAAVNVWLRDQFPMIGGSHVRKLFIQEMGALVERFHPPTTRLRMGQVLWFAVHKDAPWNCKMPMAETRLQPVVLSLYTTEDLEARLRGVPATERLEGVIARMIREAAKQEGLLTHADLALLLHCDQRTIANRIRAFQARGGTILPTRSVVHDMGAVTHKGVIVRKSLVEKKSMSQVAEETDHTPEAVNNYLATYARVAYCLERGMSVDDAAFTTGISRGLAEAYARIRAEIKGLKEKPAQGAEGPVEGI